MARKSKYSNNNIKLNKWNAALYLRLSSEDGDKDESTSIESQKHLLEDFLKNRDDITLYNIYVDDGYSGTNFNRPAFKRMFEDMKLNRFNTIIVKDLSRLGRNYIEAGNYIEQIFPLFNIRFIAVNDNIDSYLNPKSISELNLPLKNLINDEYARDISRKVSSALKTMRKNGLFTGGITPYGYKRDPKDKHHLVIDEEAAKIVKLIYKLYLEGFGIKKITNYLNEKNILNPSGYRKLNRENANRIGYFWGISTISKILDNQIYCGDMIQGKSTYVSYKIHKKVKKNKEDWDVVKSTHEPIIDRNTWNRVCELRKQAFIKVDINEKEKSLFKGKLKCADCGYKMQRQYRAESKDRVVFNCSTYISRSKKACSNHFITENMLKRIIWKVIKQEIKLFNNEKKTSRFKANMDSINKYNKEIEKENINLSRYKNIKVGLYEDWKLGNITEEEYKNYSYEYTDKINNIIKNINYLNEKVNGIKKVERNVNTSPFDSFTNCKELTYEMVEYFIDSIEVCSNNSIIINFKYRDEFKYLLLNEKMEVCYGEKA